MAFTPTGLKVNFCIFILASSIQYQEGRSNMILSRMLTF